MDTKKERAEIEAAAVALKVRIYAAISALHTEGNFRAARELEDTGRPLAAIIESTERAASL